MPMLRSYAREGGGHHADMALDPIDDRDETQEWQAEDVRPPGDAGERAPETDHGPLRPVDDDAGATQPLDPPELPEPPGRAAAGGVEGGSGLVPAGEPGDAPHDPTVELVAAEGVAARLEPEADPDVEALRDADFPVVWRGYDVQAVDAYVEAVERCVAKFEERQSPTAAVRRALDRVGEQTASILRQAELTAEEMTAVSRAQADERLQRAAREAEAMREEAVARVRDLDADIERLWQERQRLIEGTKELAAQLRTVADDAEARFPPAPIEEDAGEEPEDQEPPAAG